MGGFVSFRGFVLPEYHLIQRKRKNNRVVLYAGLVRSDGVGRYSKMIQLTTAPSLGGVRDKARRDREAYAELVVLHEAGKIGISSALDDYLLAFWDFETSEYVRSRRAEGRKLSPDYCANSQSLIRTYFLPYMQQRRINTLADLTKQVLLEWRNNLYDNGRLKLAGEIMAKGDDNQLIEPPHIAATTQNKVRQAVHVALEHAESIDLIAANPMRSLRRVAEKPKKSGIFERQS